MKKRTKFLVLRASIIALFAILSGRLWYVQVVMGSYYKGQADTSKTRIEAVQAPRGIVYDRYGRPLVYNAPSWNVTIVPHGIPRVQSGRIYGLLSHLLRNHPGPDQIAQKVHDGLWKPYTPVVIKRHVSFDAAMVIKQLHARLPGVRAEASSVRQYVRGDMLAHVLGYTGDILPAEYRTDRALYPAEKFGSTDLVGKEGIEYSLDPFLHGVNGQQRVEVDAGERPVRVLSPGKTVPGDSVYLSIDWRLQQQVATDLSAALQKLGLRRGVAILEDVHSGQILAMSSLPTYDNNLFSGGITVKAYKTLTEDPAHPMQDLATQGQFPPGSTYKVITAAAALQTGVADANRIVEDAGQIQPCPACPVFHGWKPGGLGAMNVVTALAQSSDIYFYTVAGGNPSIGAMPSIGGTRLAFWARKFGLGSPTAIELRGEASGLVPDPKWFNNAGFPYRAPGETWHIGHTYNMAIGQGQNLATPLQMVNVAATIANGGTLYRPRLVDHILGRVVPLQKVLRHPQTILPFVPSIVRRDFIDPANLALIQQGMRLSVTPLSENGTSFNVVDPRFQAAGKTGTAEDNPRPAHSWWIGYAPYQNPQVAVVVMVPNANSEGAYVSAPIAHKLFEDYFHLKPLKSNWLDDVQQQLVGGATQ